MEGKGSVRLLSYRFHPEKVSECGFRSVDEVVPNAYTIEKDCLFSCPEVSVGRDREKYGFIVSVVFSSGMLSRKV